MNNTKTDILKNFKKENFLCVDHILFGNNVQPKYTLSEDLYIMYKKLKKELLECAYKIYDKVEYHPDEYIEEVKQYSIFLTNMIRENTIKQLLNNKNIMRNQIVNKDSLLETFRNVYNPKKRCLETVFIKKCMDNLLIQPIKKDIRMSNEKFKSIEMDLLEYTNKRNSLIEFCKNL